MRGVRVLQSCAGLPAAREFYERRLSVCFGGGLWVSDQMSVREKLLLFEVVKI